MIGLTGVPVSSGTAVDLGLRKSVEEQVNIPKEVIERGEEEMGRGRTRSVGKAEVVANATATANAGGGVGSGEIKEGRKLG